MLHGEVEGMLGPFAATQRAGDAGDPAGRAARASAWDYIALGHYHVYRRLAPNQFYSGSLDYTSTNTWGERIEEEMAGVSGKGIIEHDLATGAHTFHRLAPSREFVDLPMVSARGLTTEEVNARIIDVVEVVPGRDRRQGRAARRARPAAAHHAPARPQAAARVPTSRAAFPSRHAASGDHPLRGHGAPGRRPSLADFVRDKLRERMVPADVDRDALVDLGLRYLKDAEERDSPTPYCRRGSGRRCGSTASASTNFRQHCDTFVTLRHRADGDHRRERLRQVDAARGDRVGAVRPGCGSAARQAFFALAGKPGNAARHDEQDDERDVATQPIS